MKKKFLVVAEWDEDAGVWTATSDDIPGLVTEAAKFDDLVKRVLAVAPELIEDNIHLVDDDSGDINKLVEVCVSSTFTLQSASAH